MAPQGHRVDQLTSRGASPLASCPSRCRAHRRLRGHTGHADSKTQVPATLDDFFLPGTRPNELNQPIFESSNCVVAMRTTTPTTSRTSSGPRR